MVLNIFVPDKMMNDFSLVTNKYTPNVSEGLFYNLFLPSVYLEN